jgi:transposase
VGPVDASTWPPIPRAKTSRLVPRISGLRAFELLARADPRQVLRWVADVWNRDPRRGAASPAPATFERPKTREETRRDPDAGRGARRLRPIVLVVGSWRPPNECHEGVVAWFGGLPERTLRVRLEERSKEAFMETYVGLDLSRKRIDWCAVDERRRPLGEGAVAPQGWGLAQLVRELGSSAVAVIESMNGARCVHDQLELAGWDVRIADAARAKALAPLACKTDKVDARVLAELGARDLVPEIWLPDPRVRSERELARFRIHLVKHRSMLKNRIHASLIAYGIECSVSDLFGRKGRALLDDAALPAAWRDSTEASLRLIESLDAEIDRCMRELSRQTLEHRYLPLLLTIPGIGPVLGYTIASEIGDITRFPSPRKLVGYTGLCPRVYQSGEHDRRGRISKHGPDYLRWALIEAAQTAGRSGHYRDLYQRTRERAGRQRGASIAAVTVARKLAQAIWWMLHRKQPFAPAGADRI